MAKKYDTKKIIVIVWIVFSVLYVLGNEWMRFKTFVIESSYLSGRGEAVAQVIDEARKCQAFEVNIGEEKVNLVAVECLNQEAPAEATE